MIKKFNNFDLSYKLTSPNKDNHSFLNKYFDDFIPLESYTNNDNYKVIEIRDSNNRIIACNFFVIKTDSIHINATAIINTHRKIGINQEIKNVLIEYCKNKNIKKITCNVRESNLNSLNSLLHTGFIINTNANLFYPDGEKKISLYYTI